MPCACNQRAVGSHWLGLAAAKDLVQLVSRGGLSGEVQKLFTGRVVLVDAVRLLVDPDDVNLGEEASPRALQT